MKSFGTWGAWLVICGMIGLLGGCAEEEDGVNGSSPGTIINAPSTLSGNDYNITEPSGTSTVSFSGNVYTLSRPGVAQESGTFVARKVGNDSWDVTLTNGLDGSTSRLVLTFTAEGMGTFSYTPTNATAPINGQFIRSGSGTTTTGTTTTGTTTTGTTTTGGGTPTTAPATLSQIVLNGRSGNPLGAGQTVVNISGSTFVYASGGVSGTVLYAPSGTTARLRLDDSGSADFEDYTLQFMAPSGSSTLSAYSGTQKAGVNQGPASGTFTYTQ